MSDELPILKTIKPIAKCELCGHELYAHSNCQAAGRPDGCPMNGDQWRQWMRMRDMQNVYLGPTLTTEPLKTQE